MGNNKSDKGCKISTENKIATGSVACLENVYRVTDRMHLLFNFCSRFFSAVLLLSCIPIIIYHTHFVRNGNNKNQRLASVSS